MKLIYKIIFAFSTLFFISGLCLFAGGSITTRLKQPSLELMLARGVPAADISHALWQQHFNSYGPIEVTNGTGYLLIEASGIDTNQVSSWIDGAHRIPGWAVKRLVLQRDDRTLTISLAINSLALNQPQ